MSLVLGNGLTIDFLPGGSSDVYWILLTSATNLATGKEYMLDYGVTPTAFNVTLPPSPAFGDMVTLLHIRGNVDLMPSPPKVLRNGTGELIDGLAQDLDIDINNELITFVYSGIPSVGWRLV